MWGPESVVQWSVRSVLRMREALGFSLPHSASFPNLPFWFRLGYGVFYRSEF